MRGQTTMALLTAAMLVLAGCAGGLGGVSPTNSDGATGDGGSDGGTAQVAFYVSDRPGAMDDFEHLNVTITRVGLHRVNASADAEMDDDADGEWVTHEVDDRTVDLTELRGPNATRLSVLNASPGTYDKVFVYVGSVNGTLKSGDQVNVKLPSGKLQINKGFTARSNESVEFVFDISVHKAGNSGKYILKPVISESGTSEDVEIVDVEERGDDADDESDEMARANLTASLSGNVSAGESVTLTVSDADGPVADVRVRVNGERVGKTAANGTIELTVPDADELEIEVRKGDAEVELTREFGDD